MLRKIFNSDSLYKSIPLIVILIGLIFLIIGVFIEFKFKHFNELFKQIGQITLSSGIFAVILKSFQFIGIFKEELLKIIYDPCALENRKDIQDFWKKVSNVYFKFKFPKISKNLLENISKTYLPINDKYYYENMEHTYEILRIENQEYEFKIIETEIFDIISENFETNAYYKFGNSIDEQSYYKLIHIKIDDKNHNNYKIEEKIIDGYAIQEINMNGKISYKLEKKSERLFNLDEYFISTYESQIIVNRLKIKIHILPNIKIDILKSGTINNLVLKQHNENKTYYEFEIDNLLYSQQGYHICLSKKG